MGFTRYQKHTAILKTLDDIKSSRPSIFYDVLQTNTLFTSLFRKYLAENYPDLKTDGDAFKKALEAGERRGQLERITGQGYTVQHAVNYYLGEEETSRANHRSGF